MDDRRGPVNLEAPEATMESLQMSPRDGGVDDSVRVV
jgi:hypothetical protein